MVKNVLTLLFALISCVSCSAGAAGSAQSTPSADEFPGGEIPFPTTPEEITEPADRADYIMEHFWEPLDFTSSPASDETFMEQNFVNFVQFYVFGSEQGGERATKNLLDAASATPATYARVQDLAAKYLYDRESPYYNEPVYKQYLRHAISSPKVNAEARERYAYLLEMAEKNAPGTVAADFSFVDRKGATRRLHSFSSTPYILLVFYNTDCDDCKTIINQLRGNADVNSLISRGIVQVVAIDAEGEKDEWLKRNSELPANWCVGFDTDSVVDREIYVYPSTPSIYLLDRNKTVILKDATIEQLIDYARSR